MAISAFLLHLMINLNVNGLKVSIKRHRRKKGYIEALWASHHVWEDGQQIRKRSGIKHLVVRQWLVLWSEHGQGRGWQDVWWSFEDRRVDHRWIHYCPTPPQDFTLSWILTTLEGGVIFFFHFADEETSWFLCCGGRGEGCLRKIPSWKTLPGMGSPTGFPTSTPKGLVLG